MGKDCVDPGDTIKLLDQAVSEGTLAVGLSLNKSWLLALFGSPLWVLVFITCKPNGSSITGSLNTHLRGPWGATACF